MISVNFVKPSIATMDVGNVSPCRTRDVSWSFRINNCFIAEIFGVDEQRGSVSSVMKLQCVYYDPHNVEIRKVLCNNGYESHVTAIDTVIQTKGLPTEAVAIVEQVLIDNRANLGDLRLACSRLHCLICQCLGIGFGDMKYFGWYFAEGAIDAATRSLLDCMMPKYDKGDIRHSGNFFYRIPWDCKAEKDKWLFNGKTWEQMTDTERKECIKCAKVGSCINTDQLQQLQQVAQPTGNVVPQASSNDTSKDLLAEFFPQQQV